HDRLHRLGLRARARPAGRPRHREPVRASRALTTATTIGDGSARRLQPRLAIERGRIRRPDVTKRVAKAVLIGAIPLLMLKTAANPGGLPIEVFDQLRANVVADR